MSAVSRPHKKAESCSSCEGEKRKRKRGFSGSVNLDPWMELHTLGMNIQCLRYFGSLNMWSPSESQQCKVSVSRTVGEGDQLG